MDRLLPARMTCHLQRIVNAHGRTKLPAGAAVITRTAYAVTVLKRYRVRLSVPEVAHTAAAKLCSGERCASSANSQMTRGPRQFWPDCKEVRHTCYFLVD